jgi:aspartate/methionine/tyrosine aminotransferase
VRLKQSIVDFSKRRYGVDLDADKNVLVTTSGTEALFNAVQAGPQTRAWLRQRF